MEKEFELEIIRDDPRLFTALWSDAVIFFWRADTDLGLLDVFEQDTETIKNRMNTRYVALTIVLGEKRTPPSNEARKRLSEILKQPDPHLVAAATVLQSQGFTATVSRGVLTEVDIAANRRKRDHQVFSHIREATGWLAETFGRDQKWAKDFYKIVCKQREQLERDPATG